MVVKCKPRGRVKLVEVYDQQTYQTDDPSPSRVVVDTNILSNLCSILGEVDIIEFPREYSIGQTDKMDANIEDEDEDDGKEEEFDNDVETEMMKIVLNFLNNEVPR